VPPYAEAATVGSISDASEEADLTENNSLNLFAPTFDTGLATNWISRSEKVANAEQQASTQHRAWTAVHIPSSRSK
jgi:hypothetical protein